MRIKLNIARLCGCFSSDLASDWFVGSKGSAVSSQTATESQNTPRDPLIRKQEVDRVATRLHLHKFDHLGRTPTEISKPFSCVSLL